MPAAPRISELTDHLGYWFRAVSNHVSQAFAAKLAVRGVTVAEWVMMRALYGKDPMSPSRLAGDMAMTRGAITKLADRLIEKNLVVRQANSQDARAQTLALTVQGTSLVPSLAKLADGNDREFFGHLTDAERKALERLLKRMVERFVMNAVPTE